MKNLGATCWLNAVTQCLRVCKRDWNSDKSDEFTLEFLKLVRGETDDTTQFLGHLPFGNIPNDSQEALLYILDKIGDTDFEGEVTQTIVYPGGRSVSKTPCTIWFDQGKPDAITGYVDDSGKVYNVAVIERKLTRAPKILVSDTVKEYSGKQLTGLVVWGMGHYVAYVKKSGEWWYLNDDAEPRKIDEPAIQGKRPGLVAFFTDT